MNFVRDVGSEGGRVALQPLVSRPTRIANVITVTPFAGAIITGYTKTVTGLSPGPGQGIVIEDTNDDPLVRPLAVLGGDIEARASRIYRVGFMGFDALMHVIEPRINYTFIGGRGLEGVPQVDGLTASIRPAGSPIRSSTGCSAGLPPQKAPKR